jgi:opacity protein-like surface antigen
MTRSRVRLLLVTLLLSAAAVSVASTAIATETEEPHVAPRVSPSGPRVALRSGFALPVGSAFYASGSLSDTVTGYVPVRLDVGYRFRDRYYVGLLGQLAQIVPNACPSGASCSGSDTRVGLMAAAHLFPDRTLDPWLGLGMGYELYDVTRTVDGTKAHIGAKGFELLTADLGLDVRTTRGLRLGPVLSTSIGQFTEVTVNEVTTKDFQTQLHAWVLLGLRGAYDL